MAEAKKTKKTTTKVEKPAAAKAVKKTAEEVKELKKTEKAVAAPKAEKTTEKVAKSVAKKPTRSTKYLTAKAFVDSKKKYAIADAVALAKKTSFTKFDGSVEIHIHTAVKKGQELLRGLVSLPAGAPKQPNIIIADDAVIADIKAGKIKFDVLIATPAFMPKLAVVAKTLGPKGLMPSPKSGTVTDKPEEAKKELLSGKIEYKSDALGNIHVAAGKVSWDDKKIVSNIETIINALPANRILGVVINATMGPGIRIR